ncbi:MAG: hypothetical protein VX320_03400 [Candidatus Thermoplasmatota archaeon]|nr:hypothetical protein [Candidatus Thermoplasmatota archaeon]
MVEILCPHCEDEIELDDDASGEFECPYCEGEFEWGVSSSFSGGNQKYIPVGILTFVVIFSLILVFSSGWGTISEDMVKGSFSLSEVEIEFGDAFGTLSFNMGYGEMCEEQGDVDLDSDEPDYCGLNVTSWIVKVILWIGIICLVAAIVKGGIALSNDVKDDIVVILARVGSGLLFIGAVAWAIGSAMSFGDMSWGWAFYVTVLMSAIGAVASELESGLLQDLLGIDPD